VENYPSDLSASWQESAELVGEVDAGIRLLPTAQ
jgi:hypothetical protein